MIEMPNKTTLARAREDLAHLSKLLTLGGGLDQMRLRNLADRVGEAKKAATSTAQSRRLDAAHAKLVELSGLDDADPADFTILGNLLADD